MCGIFAYSNHNCPKSQKEIVEKLLTGLRRLEYRGYDSAGLAIDDGSDASHTEARVFRQTGKIANLEALLRESDSARSALEELERSMGIAPSQQTQGGQSQPRGEARTVSSIAADIEDCEIARSAAEKDRDLLRRRKERMDRDLLDAERELAATREEHVRTQAKVERRAELRRELVRFFLGTPADPSTRDIK